MSKTRVEIGIVLVAISILGLMMVTAPALAATTTATTTVMVPLSALRPDNTVVLPGETVVKLPPDFTTHIF